MMSARRKKIFIVEDDAGIKQVIKIALEDEGYEVYLSGNDYEEGIKKVSPDLVLLDLLLSGRDGRDICVDLKKKKTMSTTPIIMFSAHPDGDRAAKEAGADAFLQKPFSMNSMLSLLKKSLERKNQ